MSDNPVDIESEAEGLARKIRELDVGDTILSLAAEREVDPALAAVRRNYCFCKMVIDEATRTVVCPKCKRLWDPIAALLHLAREWTNYAQNRDMLKHEVERLESKTAALKRELKLLNAQKRRVEKVPL